MIDMNISVPLEAYCVSPTKGYALRLVLFQISLYFSFHNASIPPRHLLLHYLPLSPPISSSSIYPQQVNFCNVSVSSLKLIILIKSPLRCVVVSSEPWAHSTRHSPYNTGLYHDASIDDRRNPLFSLPSSICPPSQRSCNDQTCPLQSCGRRRPHRNPRIHIESPTLASGGTKPSNTPVARNRLGSEMSGLE